MSFIDVDVLMSILMLNARYETLGLTITTSTRRIFGLNLEYDSDKRWIRNSVLETFRVIATIEANTLVIVLRTGVCTRQTETGSRTRRRGKAHGGCLYQNQHQRLESGELQYYELC
jgi:hypothetical protein